MPFTEYDTFDGRDDAQEPGGEGIRPSGNGASCKSEPRVPARKGRLWMKSRPFMALFLLAAFLLLLLMIWNFSTLFSGFGGNHWYDGRCDICGRTAVYAGFGAEYCGEHVAVAINRYIGRSGYCTSLFFPD